ncbi:hypothetical protein HDU93_009612 [Gonapodya sp. JEL0774]|nr:hypothetical protein HDU93_009612 [Gonapodya sp. JEL0774]
MHYRRLESIVNENLWYEAFALRRSIAGQAFPSVLILTAWTVAVAVLNLVEAINFRLPSSFITLLGVVLGLLLAFRSAQAYERFSEGRKTWGTLQFQCRNAIRSFALSFVATEAGEAAKQKAIKQLIAFVYSLKHYLRSESSPEQLADMVDVMDVIPISNSFRPNFGGVAVPALSPSIQVTETDPLLGPYSSIIQENGNAMPFKIVLCLARLLQTSTQEKLLVGPYAGAAQSAVAGLVESATTMERIATSPMCDLPTYLLQ